MKRCWLYLKSKLDSQVLLLHAFTAHFWFIRAAAAAASAALPADTLTSESHQVSDLKGSFLIYSAAHRIPLPPRRSTLTVALNTPAAFGSSIEIEPLRSRTVQLQHSALFKGFIMKWRCKQIVFSPTFSLDIPFTCSPFSMKSREKKQKKQSIICNCWNIFHQNKIHPSVHYFVSISLEGHDGNFKLSEDAMKKYYIK